MSASCRDCMTRSMRLATAKYCESNSGSTSCCSGAHTKHAAYKPSERFLLHAVSAGNKCYCSTYVAHNKRQDSSQLTEPYLMQQTLLGLLVLCIYSSVLPSLPNPTYPLSWYVTCARLSTLHPIWHMPCALWSTHHVSRCVFSEVQPTPHVSEHVPCVL